MPCYSGSDVPGSVDKYQLARGEGRLIYYFLDNVCGLARQIRIALG